MNQMKFIHLYFAMAWRNIWRQKKRSYLVMATALVGMLGVTIMMGWVNGLFDAMLTGAIDTGLGHIQVRPTGYDRLRKNDMRFDNPEEIKKSLDSLGDIDGYHYSIRLEREGMLRLGSFSRGVLLMGIDPKTEPGVSSFDKWIVQGEYLTEENKASGDGERIECLIGYEAAQKMEVEVGDRVILSTGDKDGQTSSVQAEIQGIFRSPVGPINKYTVILKQSQLSQMYDPEHNYISSFVFHGKNREDLDIVAQKIRALFSNSDSSAPDVLTFMQLQAELRTILEMSDQFMGIFYFILMTGFALTLLNSVLMSVFERVREIGIQKAIGARTSVIILGILVESFVLSVLGSGVGFIVGGTFVLILGFSGISLGLFAEAMDMLGNINSIIYPYLTLDDILTAFILAFSVSMIAGFYPAWKASKTNPIKAIQNR